MADATLLPPNATALERALAASAPLDLPVRIGTLWNAETCPAELLPWLAWALSVDFWSLAGNEAQQRGLIANAITWHRKRGTPWALKQALATVGYPGSTLIEYQDYRQQWSAVGGRLLDGSWATDCQDAITPQAVAITDVGQLALSHWAEYAIRLNIGEGLWTREQQRAVRRLAGLYAPERSHLRGLLVHARLDFDASIRLVDARISGRTRFDRCTRLAVHGWRVLDGCWLIEGEEAPLLLDGTWSIGAPLDLEGTQPAGLPLDAGFASFAARGRTRLSLAGAGGDRLDPPRPLLESAALNGQWYLDGPRLTGQQLLDGRNALDYPLLATLGQRRLDGTWHLGCVPGQVGVWFSAIATVRHADGSTTREVL